MRIHGFKGVGVDFQPTESQQVNTGADNFSIDDTANKNKWGQRRIKYFFVQPETAGAVQVLTYDQYMKDDYTIVDGNAITLIDQPAGKIMEMPVVKLYAAGTVPTTCQVYYSDADANKSNV